jgi:hypothetical protein
MTEEELKTKMLEFIDKQDHTYDEEWWCTPRTLYAGIMKEFGVHVGIDLAVPHQDRTPPPDVDRNAMLKELLPEIQKAFNVAYKERNP